MQAGSTGGPYKGSSFVKQQNRIKLSNKYKNVDVESVGTEPQLVPLDLGTASPDHNLNECPLRQKRACTAAYNSSKVTTLLLSAEVHPFSSTWFLHRLKQSQLRCDNALKH